jgi:putative SOS response-associated peptidase YedK
MCGRFTLQAGAPEIARLFGVEDVPTREPRYNIAPTQPVVALRAAPDGGRELALFQWGLVPYWAKDPAIGNRMINARAETVFDRPSYRNAARRRRCLVPADGFFEWMPGPRGKQPYYIQLADGGLFAIAGLWERWEGPDDSIVESCALITAPPNDLMRSIHDRMPAILPPEDWSRWLDAGTTDPALLEPLLRPYAAGDMRAVAVSTRVNSPRYDDIGCIEPLSAAGPRTGGRPTP